MPRFRGSDSPAARSDRRDQHGYRAVEIRRGTSGRRRRRRVDPDSRSRRSRSSTARRATTSRASSRCSGAPWRRSRRAIFDTASDSVRQVLAIGRDYGLPTTTGHALSTAGADRSGARECRRMRARSRPKRSRSRWRAATAGESRSRSTSSTHIAAARGRLEDALRLAAAVDAHRNRMAVGLPGLAPRERDALFATLRSTLGLDFKALYAEGLSWSTEQTVAAALAETLRHTVERPIPQPASAPRVAERPAETVQLRVLALGPLQVFVGDRLIDVARVGLGSSARAARLSVDASGGAHEGAGRTRLLARRESGAAPKQLSRHAASPAQDARRRGLGRVERRAVSRRSGSVARVRRHRVRPRDH